MHFWNYLYGTDYGLVDGANKMKSINILDIVIYL